MRHLFADDVTIKDVVQYWI